VLITEFEGAQPVTPTFNVEEKKGVAQFELGRSSVSVTGT
jgi:hypothetical protein